jgi:hypothetical protein
VLFARLRRIRFVTASRTAARLGRNLGLIVVRSSVVRIDDIAFAPRIRFRLPRIAFAALAVRRVRVQVTARWRVSALAVRPVSRFHDLLLGVWWLVGRAPRSRVTPAW